MPIDATILNIILVFFVGLAGVVVGRGNSVRQAKTASEDTALKMSQERKKEIDELKAELAERDREHLAALAERDKAHTAALAAQDKAHDKEIADLRVEFERRMGEMNGLLSALLTYNETLRSWDGKPPPPAMPPGLSLAKLFNLAAVVGKDAPGLV